MKITSNARGVPKSSLASITAATRLWPTETFLPTPRCTKISDGMTDAALIAEYGRRAIG